MDLQNELLSYGEFLSCNLFDEGYRLEVVDGFKMIAHRFPANGQTFFYDQSRFLQRKRIAFYPIALESIGNVECLLHLCECSRRKGAMPAQLCAECIRLFQQLL